jgi:hypothetical protein
MTGVAEIFLGLLLTVAVLALVAGLIPTLPKVRLYPEVLPKNAWNHQSAIKMRIAAMAVLRERSEVTVQE